MGTSYEFECHSLGFIELTERGWEGIGSPEYSRIFKLDYIPEAENLLESLHRAIAKAKDINKIKINKDLKDKKLKLAQLKIDIGLLETSIAKAEA